MGGSSDGTPHDPTGSEAAGRVFVYGTLKPGHLRWPLLEPFVVDHRRATAPGRLYDTGLGYPAARFDHDGRIIGVVARLADADRDRTWDLLDHIEGPDYERRVVATDDGPATAYHFRHPVDGLPDLDGTWAGE